LVDACRNNPLVKYFQNGKHKGSVAKKGLGQVTPTVGQVVIGFATSAGDTADDGNGRMSPYAEALSKWLREPDDIRNILGEVGKRVSRDYEQNPIYKSNLASSVYLVQENEVTSIVKIDNLMYQNHPFIKGYTWQNAQKYCQNLTLGNYSNWRLGSHNELKKLSTDYGVQANPIKSYIAKAFIKNIIGDSRGWFWTGHYKKNLHGEGALAVGFGNSTNGWSSKPYRTYYKLTTHLYALCVRDIN